jgi:cation diffusion facilitator family transporter
MPLFKKITNNLVKPNIENARKYRSSIGKLQGWVSVIINGLLFVLKLIMGLMVGSISLMADAIHTLSDVISSGVVIWGFNEAEKPPDKEHPYGHGRAEYIATLIIAILLCVAGIEFIKSSFDRIMNPEPIEPAWWMIVAIVLTIVLKEITARYATYLSEKIASGTLKADAWHHRTDAISSLLVVIAMIAGKYHYSAIDGWAGVGVAFFIIWTGYTIARESIDDLLGSPPTEDEIEEIRQIVCEVDGVLGAHDITIHSYGKDKFVGIHVEISDDETAARAHDIAEDVEQALAKMIGIEPTVHVDPIGLENPMVKEIHDYLNNNWVHDERISGVHDIRVVDTERHHVILLGVNIKPEVTGSKRHKLRDELRTALEKQFSGFDADLKISPIHRY